MFGELEALFRGYGENGRGKVRKYLHDEQEAAPYRAKPGTFTEWQELPEDTDLLFYEGLHGAIAHGDVDVARHVDLLIGVVPVVNLEWIQKLHRDKSTRGYSAEAVTDTILRRMHDYVHHICPQFSRTHINFQRVPVVDTSNPFIARFIPTPDEILPRHPLRPRARDRFSLSAVDAPRLVHVPVQHDRVSRRKDGPRHAADSHADDLAPHRAPKRSARPAAVAGESIRADCRRCS